MEGGRDLTLMSGHYSQPEDGDMGGGVGWRGVKRMDDQIAEKAEEEEGWVVNGGGKRKEGQQQLPLPAATPIQTQTHNLFSQNMSCITLTL